MGYGWDTTVPIFTSQNSNSRHRALNPPRGKLHGELVAGLPRACALQGVTHRPGFAPCCPWGEETGLPLHGGPGGARLTAGPHSSVKHKAGQERGPWEHSRKRRAWVLLPTPGLRCEAFTLSAGLHHHGPLQSELRGCSRMCAGSPCPTLCLSHEDNLRGLTPTSVQGERDRIPRTAPVLSPA